MRIISSTAFRQEELNYFLNRGKNDISEIKTTIRMIIDDVKEEGDKALLNYTEKFDKINLSISKLRVCENEIKDAFSRLKESQVKALQKAADNIAAFHKKQLRTKWTMQATEGVTLGQVTRPLESVGIYVPGGKASYPSSVLMCAVPAKVAGVEKIIVCSPPGKGGDVDPSLLVAAEIAGVSEFYRVGGAQAIAAMAYGTDTIKKIDKIVGPGNIYVTAAKLEVSKDVAIDIPAGPSEILVIADDTANSSYVAADLLAQAEHDPQAWAILLTTSEILAEAVKDEVYTQMKYLSRIEIITSFQQRGLIVTVPSIKEAIELSNMIAPEHLQIQTKSPDEVFGKIRNAGAVFLGNYSPVSFGDYSSGLNHVLPTAGFAKIYSGLSSLDFVKTMNFLHCSKEGYRNLKDTTVTIAEMEGFDAHARAVSIRENQEK
jgi:histidinol dehydrogenase